MTPVEHPCRAVAVEERRRLGQRELRRICAVCGADMGWRVARPGETAAEQTA